MLPFSLLFFVCDKNAYQKQFGEKVFWLLLFGFFLFLFFFFPLHLTGYNPPWREVGAGIQDRDLESEAAIMENGFLACPPCLSQLSFLYSSEASVWG